MHLSRDLLLVDTLILVKIEKEIDIFHLIESWNAKCKIGFV